MRRTRKKKVENHYSGIDCGSHEEVRAHKNFEFAHAQRVEKLDFRFRARNRLRMGWLTPGI